MKCFNNKYKRNKSKSKLLQRMRVVGTCIKLKTHLKTETGYMKLNTGQVFLLERSRICLHCGTVTTSWHRVRVVSLGLYS